MSPQIRKLFRVKKSANPRLRIFLKLFGAKKLKK